MELTTLAPRALAVMIATLVATVGCNSAEQACAGNVVTPVTVTVMEMGTNLFVCDARVTATSGSATYTATAPSNVMLSDASCTYGIYPSMSGTYSITASAPGLHATQSPPTVALEFDNCGYEGAPQFLTVVVGP